LDFTILDSEKTSSQDPLETEIKNEWSVAGEVLLDTLVLSSSGGDLSDPITSGRFLRNPSPKTSFPNLTTKLVKLNRRLTGIFSLIFYCSIFNFSRFFFSFFKLMFTLLRGRDELSDRSFRGLSALFDKVCNIP